MIEESILQYIKDFILKSSEELEGLSRAIRGLG